MPSNDPSPLPALTPDLRRVAVESFERANQIIATGKNYDYAIRLLQTCCRLDPGNLTYRQTLRRTQKNKYDNNLRGSRWAWLTTSRSRTKLKLARRNRDYLKVLEYGEEILTRNPWDLGVSLAMAEAFDALGLLDLAIYTLDQTRQKFDRDPALNRTLARLFEKRGNFTQAIYLWGLVREVAPDDVEAAHKAKDLAASETIQRGQYEKEVEADESAETKPTPATRNKAAIAQPTTGRTSEVVNMDKLTRETQPLLARLEANPTDPTLYLEIAKLYRRANQTDRAREILQKGLDATGSDFRILLESMELDLEPFRRDLALTEERIRRATAAGEEANEDWSIDDLQRLRRKLLKEINSRELEMFRLRADRYPMEPSYKLELGVRLMRAEQFEEAITELQSARKEAKHAWKATMLLADCFRKRSNWRLAQRNYEEALTLIPSTEEAARKEILFNLASGLAENGELQRALDLGHELANIDYGYRNIGRLIDEWNSKLQRA